MSCSKEPGSPNRFWLRWTFSVAAVLLVFLPACGAKVPPPSQPVGPSAPAPAVEPPVPIAPAAPASPPATGTQRPPQPAPLLGHITPAALKAYEPWRSLFASAYLPDPKEVRAVAAAGRDVDVVLIIGTWCPDSRREVPRYLAIMDAAGLPQARLTMVGVDRTKKDTEGLTQTWNITRVPTFVFAKGGVEMGRIIERVPSETTLEGEIARILGGQPGR